MTKDATTRRIYTNANTEYRTRNNLSCIVFIAEFNTCLLLTLYTISNPHALSQAIKQLLTKKFITFFFSLFNLHFIIIIIY